MRKIYTIAIVFFMISVSCAQTEKSLNIEKTSSLVIGQSEAIFSTSLNEKRTINIQLPDDYDDQKKDGYPVIYILDGGMEEDFMHIAGIVRYNTQPWINRFAGSIVVGIENTDRKRDFSFAVANLDFLKRMNFDEQYFPTYGGSAAYISFLEKELQPHIESNYNTGNNKTVIGESFAGLLATEILLKHSDLFDNYLIISPSLWWNNGSLLTNAATELNERTNKAINVYIGASAKAEDKIMYNDAVRLHRILKKHGGQDMKVIYDYLPNEIHSTVIHQAVYNGFKLLYPKTAYQP